MENKIYKIVKIIDDETLVINAGSNDNIQCGDEFEIFEVGEEINDPDTGAKLGTLDTIKETVQAINVFPQISVCRHIEVSSLTSITPVWVRKTNKTLNVDSTQISGGLSDDKVIRIGDKVRLIPQKDNSKPD